jgi:hypothetical protein
MWTAVACVLVARARGELQGVARWRMLAGLVFVILTTAYIWMNPLD